MRAILADAEPILARARAVFAQTIAMETRTTDAAKGFTDDLRALDGLGELAAVLTGGASVHDALFDLCRSADPDDVRVGGESAS